MKMIFTVPIFVIFLGIIFINTGCKSTGNVVESKSTSVVTVDKKIEPVTSFVPLLDQAVKDIRSSDECDNFILFVHGRGKHPDKAFEQSLIFDLESNYTAKVIMFHWPSWEGALDFPEGNARKSAKDFITVLKGLKEYQHNNRQLVQNIKFSLLAHSMGSIVLEETILKMDDNSLGKIFDTVVVSSSASAGKNHSNWVTDIYLSDNIYITVNQDDPILGKAGIKMKGRRLGKGLENRQGDKFGLADNAKYIDLTESSLGHRYYLYRNLKERPVAKSFFDRALNGLPAILDMNHGVREVRRERVYVMRKSP